MSQSSNGLHFDRISLSEGSVQDTRGVNTLNSHILKISVAHIKILSGKRHRRNLNIGPSEFIDKTRLSDIGVAEEKNRWQVRVNGWEPTDVFSDLLQIGERRPYSLNRGTHSTESSYLKSLAPVERI